MSGQLSKMRSDPRDQLTLNSKKVRWGGKSDNYWQLQLPESKSYKDGSWSDS